MTLCLVLSGADALGAASVEPAESTSQPVTSQPAAPSTQPSFVGEVVGEPPAAAAVAGSGSDVPSSPTSAPADVLLPAPSVATNAELDAFQTLITSPNTPDARCLGAKQLLRRASAEDAADRLGVILSARPADFVAQVAVCEALSCLPAGNKAPAPLLRPVLELLGGDQPGIQAAVAQALHAFDSAEVVDRLGKISREASVDAGRRLAAIRALGTMGDDIAAVGVLAELLSVKEEAIRDSALLAFSEAAGLPHADASAAMEWWKSRESVTTVDWLRSVNRRQAQRIRLLVEEEAGLTVRFVEACRESYLRSTEAERSAKLLSLLGDPLSEVRRLGLDLINALITDRKDVDQEIKDRLVQMISDSDAMVRLDVAGMVGDLRLTTAVGRLVDVLGKEPDFRVRVAQVKAIGRLDGEQAIPSLLRSLEENVPSVVSEAASALATISGRVTTDPDLLGRIAQALLDRFKRIDAGDAVLREKVLDAMARMGHESFRPVFKTASSPNHAPALRRVAISGLAAMGDVEAADDIASLVGSSEPEIRLAAVQALARCGRREQDLAALIPRLDVKSESDSTVRERAWECYVSISKRLLPQSHLKVASGFASPKDKISQRRRLDLLRALTGDVQRFKQLAQDEQIAALEGMSDAQHILGEVSAAAGALEQALTMVHDPSSESAKALRTQWLVMLVLARDDTAMIRHLGAVINAGAEAEAGVDWMILAGAICDDAALRLEASKGAAPAVSLLKFLDAVSVVSKRAGGDFEMRLVNMRSDITAKYPDSVSQLLDEYAEGADVGSVLLGIGSEVALPPLYKRLISPVGDDKPDRAIEGRLVAIAKKLAPTWTGFEPGCAADERAAAMGRLKAIIAPPQPVPVVPPASFPTSQPAQ